MGASLQPWLSSAWHVLIVAPQAAGETVFWRSHSGADRSSCYRQVLARMQQQVLRRLFLQLVQMREGSSVVPTKPYKIKIRKRLQFGYFWVFSLNTLHKYSEL